MSGRPRTRWTPETVARLRAHAAAGHTQATAAADLGCSYAAAAQHSSSLGIKFYGNCNSPPPAARTLAAEIEAARAEAPFAPPYRARAGWPG